MVLIVLSFIVIDSLSNKNFGVTELYYLYILSNFSVRLHPNRLTYTEITRKSLGTKTVVHRDRRRFRRLWMDNLNKELAKPDIRNM